MEPSTAVTHINGNRGAMSMKIMTVACVMPPRTLANASACYIMIWDARSNLTRDTFGVCDFTDEARG